MTYLQITLALVEIVSAGAVVWQLGGTRDPLWIPFLIILVGAGVLVPMTYPIGHATVVSLGLQVVAAAALLWIARLGLRRGSAGRHGPKPTS